MDSTNSYALPDLVTVFPGFGDRFGDLAATDPTAAANKKNPGLATPGLGLREGIAWAGR
jgi:hypothetical protein